MYATRHFVTGGFKSHASFVSDETYSLILDNIVKATIDIYVQRPDGKVLLGHRVGLPHADWWIPGGRMMPGEDVPATTKRVLQREIAPYMKECAPVGAAASAAAGAEVADKPAPWLQLRTVGHYTFIWDTRTQQPIDHGTCDVSIVVCVQVTDADAARVVLAPQEYTSLCWCDPRGLHGEAGADGAPVAIAPEYIDGSDTRDPPKAHRPLHPALRQSLKDLVAMGRWDTLARAMESGASDEEVARCARAYHSALGPA